MHDWEGAVAAYRKHLAQNPDEWDRHFYLAQCLYCKGDLDEAIAEFRRAIDISPKTSVLYFCLGIALEDKGDLDEAITAFRKCSEIDPSFSCLYNIGSVLLRKGQLNEAIIAYRTAVGDSESREQRYAADPRWAKSHAKSSLRRGRRHDLACVEVWLGTLQGHDAAALDPVSQSSYRRQALGWLQADLTAANELLNNAPDDAPVIAKRMRHWQQNRDFSVVRDAAAFAKLPEDEQRSWQELWADVGDVLARAEMQAVSKTKLGDRQPEVEVDRFFVFPFDRSPLPHDVRLRSP
jgi:hypothetical protein